MARMIIFHVRLERFQPCSREDVFDLGRFDSFTRAVGTTTAIPNVGIANPESPLAYVAATLTENIFSSVGL
jgi:hypothetical protein